MIPTPRTEPEARRRRRHRIHANPFSVRWSGEIPDWQTVYAKEAPLALEVGFGPGQFLLELARQHPKWNVLGLEIRPHLVERVLEVAKTEGLGNVHAVLANANLHLDELIPDRSLQFVAINFPDPWFKKRHHKRRVVQWDWLNLITQKLQDGAQFHLMTDYAPIGHEAAELFAQRDDFEFESPSQGFASETTTGIRSERELIHMRRGDQIYRLHLRFRCTSKVELPAEPLAPTISQ